jgi:hypothetical protein
LFEHRSVLCQGAAGCGAEAITEAAILTRAIALGHLPVFTGDASA